MSNPVEGGGAKFVPRKGRDQTFLAVSKAAGVSPSTVSRVAKGSLKVNPELAARVRSVAASIGVDLDKRFKAGTIAILLSNRDFSHRVHAAVMRGAQAYAAARGLDTIVVPLTYSLAAKGKEIRLPRIMQERRIIRAAILVGVNSDALMQVLDERRIPFAAFGNNVVGDWKGDQRDDVSFDGIQGGHEATAHLIGLGHRLIWHLTDTEYPWFAAVAEGYRRAISEAGLESRILEVRAQEAEIGYLGAKSIVARKKPATAIFAASDEIACGVYRALGESRVRIPDDISVVGGNGTQGDNLNPPMTSCRFFFEEMGAHLVEFALNRCQNPTLEPQHFVVPMSLVKRSSCAPPPAPEQQLGWSSASGDDLPLPVGTL